MKSKFEPFVTLIVMTAVAVSSPASLACSEHGDGGAAPQAKANQVISSLKAGHPDESAKLICEILLNMQLELPVDPRYATNSAQVLGEAPKMIKDMFHRLLDEQKESTETKQIIDSLVDNTVPKDYDAQLKGYAKNLQAALDQLKVMQSVTDSEGLKYGDPLSTLEPDPANTKDPNLSAAKMEKLGKTLDSLATQARFMPVGDVRAAVGLYTLALAANSAQRYKEAETFAQQSINHVNATADNMPVIPQVQLALAYALMKQEKNDEFKTLRDSMIKTVGVKERTLVTLARFTENTGDYSGAAAIYKQALDDRTRNGTTQKPEWMDSYNELLKRVATK